MTPEVSVLIPCFNAAQWIGEAVESALSQTFRNIEVIVVDDGSTDATPVIIRQFEPYIVSRRLTRSGAPVARNLLLDLSQSEWVQFLDADDALYPTKIEDQLSEVSQSPHADVIVGPVEIESWRDGKIVDRTISEVQSPIVGLDPWGLLALWKLPQTGGALWRKRALLDVGGWREDQPCCQEHELYLRLLIAGKQFAFTSVAGAVYRRFETGTLSTTDMPLVRSERLKIEERLEDHLEATGGLTQRRQWAINQARFEMARSAWPEDREEARAIAATIRKSENGFRPAGPAAPPAYSFFYRAFGFEIAERAAAMKRAVISTSI